MLRISEKDGSITFEIKVTPRAPKSSIAGQHDGTLKLRIAAPPVDGKANEECERFLAEFLGVSRGSVEIISGSSSRNKVVRIKKVTAKHLLDTLPAQSR